MATPKTATLAFRIDPEVKEALRTAAQQEHRSIANRVEVPISDYCARKGITVQKQRAPLPDEHHKPQSSQR